MGNTELTQSTAIIVIEIPTPGDESGQGLMRIGVFADALKKVITIMPESVEPPPKVGLRVKTAFILGMGPRRRRLHRHPEHTGHTAETRTSPRLRKARQTPIAPRKREAMTKLSIDGELTVSRAAEGQDAYRRGIDPGRRYRARPRYRRNDRHRGIPAPRRDGQGMRRARHSLRSLGAAIPVRRRARRRRGVHGRAGRGRSRSAGTL